MITTYLFDLAKVILFPTDSFYQGELNAKFKELKNQPDFDFAQHFALDQRIVTWLREQKNRRQLYMFTSGTIQQAPSIWPVLSDLFIEIFSAEEMGMSKKDPAPYRQILEKLQLEPQAVVFIDDTLANVMAAKAAGLHAIQFSTLEKLQFELSQLEK